MRWRGGRVVFDGMNAGLGKRLSQRPLQILVDAAEALAIVPALGQRRQELRAFTGGAG